MCAPNLQDKGCATLNEIQLSIVQLCMQNIHTLIFTYKTRNLKERVNSYRKAINLMTCFTCIFLYMSALI